MDSCSESSVELHPSDACTDEEDLAKKARTRDRSGSARSLANSGLSRRQITETKQVHRESVLSIYLFFCGTLLLTITCTLVSSGVWCFLVRLPMIQLVNGPTMIIMALSGYIVVAGALTFPASCFLYREHNVTRRTRTLLPAITLLLVCTIFLGCCASHAMLYRMSAYSHLEDSANPLARLRCCGVNADDKDDEHEENEEEKEDVDVDAVERVSNSTPSAAPTTSCPGSRSVHPAKQPGVLETTATRVSDLVASCPEDPAEMRIQRAR